jgi:O-antigen/teichoic acid export membrane protein
VGQSTGRAIGETSAANVLIMVAQVGAGALAARLLGPEGRGELAAIQLWPSTLITFGSLGLIAAATYFSGREKAQAGEITGTAWIALMAMCLPLIGLGYWLLPALLHSQPARVVRTARIMLWLVPIQFSGNLPFGVLQGLGRFRIWNVVRVEFTLLWAGALLISLWTGHRDAPFVAIGYLIAMGVHAATWIAALLYAVPGPYRAAVHRIPDMLRYGVPAIATGIPQQLNLRLDQMLMGAFLPARVLGLYVVAAAVSGVMAPILTAVSQVMFSHLARVEEREKQEQDTARAMRLSSVAALGLVAALLVMTPVALPLVYGLDFGPAIPAAMVLIVAGGIANLNVIAGECLRGMGLPRLPLIAEGAGLVITFVLLALLLNRYQLMGAAAASFSAYAAVLLAYLILLNRRTRIPIRMFLIPRGDELRGLLSLARGSLARGFQGNGI